MCTDRFNNQQNSVTMVQRETETRPLVYICSPYSGDVQNNTHAAKTYSRFAVDNAAIPFTPHLLFPQFMCEMTERELVLSMDIKMLDLCDELWVFGHKITSGMEVEISRAKRKSMIIRYFSENLQEIQVSNCK